MRIHSVGSLVAAFINFLPLSCLAISCQTSFDSTIADKLSIGSMETQHPQPSDGLLKPMTNLGIDSTPTTLLELPSDIQLIISGYIRAPSDLKSLCLTCKALADSATIQLYRKVSLAIDLIDENLCNSLRAQNRGMRHLKVLEVVENEPTSYRDAIQGQYLKQLLSALPVDSLTSVSISTHCGMSYYIEDLIIRTQSKLSNHEAHVSGLTGSIRAPLRLDSLQHIMALNLYIERSEDIARYTGVLGRLRRLIDLVVIIVRPSDDGNLSDVFTLDVMRAIFAVHASYSTPALRLGLKSLLLECFDFQHSAQDMVDFLQATSIESLNFAQCAATWRVVDRWKHISPNLKSFIDQEFLGDHGIAPSINGILGTFQGLKKLTRTFEPSNNGEWDNCKGFAWNAIKSRAETLRILEIDNVLADTECWKPNSHRSMDCFQALCSKLVHLQQLSIRPPDVNPQAWRMPGPFLTFLDCLKHLKSLTAHKLMVRPESLKETPLFEFDCRVPRLAEYEMQELADTVFETLHDSYPQFTALLLHATGMWDSDDSLDRLFGKDFGFMRGSRSDQYGRRRVAAHPVPREQIKYHEPCSEVFEES